MAARIDLKTTTKSVRDFIQQLGAVRQPVELVLEGVTIVKIVAPGELSDAEKEQVLNEGWAAVQKARGNAKGVRAADIRKTVDRVVREVRTRHAQRRR